MTLDATEQHPNRASILEVTGEADVEQDGRALVLAMATFAVLHP